MKKILLLFAAIMMARTGLYAELVDYLYPVYNTDGAPASGIKEWKTASVYAAVVTNASTLVDWGDPDATTWYVVTGTDVKLLKGAICAGNVNLILADGAKLTATGERNSAGIQVSREDYSLTIYGQANQSGQLVANGDQGAGIGGGGDRYESGSNITINGGTVIATSSEWGAGIGGGSSGKGSYITINGGTVTANGGYEAAGIGGGEGSSGSNIIINGGIVTANGGDGCDGIGSGFDGGESSNIFVADGVKVMTNESVIAHTSSDDIAEDLAGKQNVTAFDLAPYLKAINDAAGNYEDATITGIANTAEASILGQTTADRARAVSDLAVEKINAIKEILTLIADDTNVRNTTFISEIITNIASAVSVNDVTINKTQAVNEIPTFLTGRSSALGSMGTKQNGPAVEVIDQDDNIVILYNPKKVNFIKVETEE